MFIQKNFQTTSMVLVCGTDSIDSSGRVDGFETGVLK